LKYEDNQVGATAYEPCAPPTAGRRS
jgi:hypothetical protein